MTEEDRENLGPMLGFGALLCLGFAWGICGEKTLGVLIAAPFAALSLLVVAVDCAREFRQWAGRGGDYGAY